jgi:hypothetical protein
MTRRLPRLWLAVVVAAASLVVVGFALGSARATSSDFGWFAYAGSGTMGSRVWVIVPRQLAGFLVAVAGVVLLAAAVGYRIGARHAAVAPTD